MSIFNELLPKITEISNAFTNKFKNELQTAIQSIDKLEQEFIHSNRKTRTRDKLQKDKNVTTLQRIHEDDNESTKSPESNSDRTSSDSTGQRGSKKRSKHEVEGLESPEQEKRQKRNASVKAQSIITKQVNVNLTQKMRRENSTGKSRSRPTKDEDKENTLPLLVQVKQEKISLPPEPMEINSTDDDTSPLKVTVKQEIIEDDIAMPPPMAPVPKTRKAVQKEKSEEFTEDDKENSSRRRTTKTKKQTDIANTSAASSRSTRASRASSRATGKQADAEDTQPRPRAKQSRAKKMTESLSTDTEKDAAETIQNGTASPADKPRPKRTRRAQKAAEKEAELAKEIEQTKETVIMQSESQPEVISPKEERVSEPQILSPLLQPKPTKPNRNQGNTKLQGNNTIVLENHTKLQETNTKLQEIKNKQIGHDKETTKIPLKTGSKLIKNLNNNNHDATELTKDIIVNIERLNEENIKNKDKNGLIDTNKEKDTNRTKNINENDQIIKDMNAKNNLKSKVTEENEDVTDNIELDKTRVLSHLNSTVTISTDLNQTVVLPNGVYNHAPTTPKPVRILDETIVIAGKDVSTDKPQQNIMNSTVVLDKADSKTTNLTDDNSLLTDDSDAYQTPPKEPPVAQPTSAVKVKVQQFEEMASRVTRTKTRAMVKKEEEPAEHTPPDKVSKAILSAETLAKMNSMIFNGKPSQLSGSSSKPRPLTASASKMTTPAAPPAKLSVNKAREADELKREREDARKKKEALLDAKREMQRKKREDKMAAAAAAREAAERERRAAMEAAARERMEKQAHADLGKLERLREAERKKQEFARKVAETEERRKAEEQARQKRLADEQKRAEAARKKQLEETELEKKEAAIINKEIERKQKEFLERQKRLKHIIDDNKIYSPHRTVAPMEPAHMADGFQHLVSDDEDDDDDAPPMPVPTWSVPKRRNCWLEIQAQITNEHVDRLFSVRVYSPDLRAIFPNIERARLKRTSSAVWRTPPAALPTLRE